MDARLPCISQKRPQALARGETLTEHTHRAALVADISGFTPLTATRAQEINRIYAALVPEVDRYSDSVLGFAGDAITCWFADQEPKLYQVVQEEVP
jgi:class 3 adenylate cyclase